MVKLTAIVKGQRGEPVNVDIVVHFAFMSYNGQYIHSNGHY